MTIVIEPIAYSNGLFAPILAEAERAGGGFMLRARDEWLSGAQRFDRPGEFLPGLHRDGELVAVGGVSRDPYDPQPGLGRVRHIYVLESARRQGLGSALVRAIIERSRGHFSVLRLRTRTAGAAALYESLGFLPSIRNDETHRLALG